MYSLGALYISDTDVISIFNGETAMQLSQRMATIAQLYSRSTSDQPSVLSVQANTLLGFRELICRNTSGAWMYTGLAIRMAQEIRLGKEYFQKYPCREREVRRRTMWTCFIMDRLLCFLTARPQVFRSRQISIQLPCSTKGFLFDEDFSGPTLMEFPFSVSQDAEVLPFFIKAVELWGVLIDLYGTVGNHSPVGTTEYEDEFFDGHAKVKEWLGNLPSKMIWSTRNYRVFRLLGEGHLFVSMHMVLNHALCTLQQAYLPQADPLLSSTAQDSQTPTQNEEIAAACFQHANALTDIAASLYQGDEEDREALKSPFSGAAIVSVASVHLWDFYSGHSNNHINIPEDSKIAMLMDILRSWEPSWPIARSWIETVELMSLLYAVAYGKADQEELSYLTRSNARISHASSPDDADPDTAGLPEASKVSHRLFEKVRHIMFTVSEPSARRKLQTQLHIKNLWNHMCLQAQMASIYPDYPVTSDILTSDIDGSPEVPFGWGDYLSLLDTNTTMSIETNSLPILDGFMS